MAVDAVAIKQKLKQLGTWFVPLIVGFSLPLTAAILPEDRSDALYHSYEGDEVRITGPSLQLRKSIGEHVSLRYNYYVDNITSASVDVRTYGSPYKETRTENGVGFDFLKDKTTMSLGYTISEENDYSAKTGFFSVSHDMFGDLTTLAMSFSTGEDEVRKAFGHTLVDGYRVSDQSELKGNVKRYSYALDFTQILTKNAILNLGFETITDNGYLNNPQRQVLVVDRATPTLLTRVPEDGRYPKVHTSNAAALRAMYYLPYRAKLYAELRGFADDWDVQGQMSQIGYTHPFSKDLVLDVSYRLYSQTKASFYQDYFEQELVYMARDKELSSFRSNTLAATLNWQFFNRQWLIFDKGTLNASLSKLALSYDDFYDRSKDVGADSVRFAVDCPQCEPYSINANVLQFYLSLWY